MKTSTPALLGLLTAVPATAYKCGRGHQAHAVEAALWNQLLLSSFPDPGSIADYVLNMASPSYFVSETPSHYRMEVRRH